MNISNIKEKYKDFFFLFIASVGAVITLFGISQNSSQIFYILGASFLLISAVFYNLLYFIALEIILIAGHAAILFGIGTALQIALPLLLSAQLLFFYFLSGRLNSIFLFIGIIGIALISIGFSYNNQWIFLGGSTAIAAYGYYNSKANKASLIWAVLNTVFALTALFKITLLNG